MASVRSILKPPVTLETEIGNTPVVLSYKPQFINPTFEATIRTMARYDANNPDQEITMLVRKLGLQVIVSWDLTWDEDGKDPVVLSEDGLADFPTEVLQEIIDKIMADASDPNRKTGPTSDGGSQPVVGSENAPNGIPSSEPQGTSA